MNGIEKLRKFAIDMCFFESKKDVKKQVVSSSRSDRYPSMSTFSFIISLADQISIEHKEELAEKTATICRQNAEIAQLRADLAAAKRDMSDDAREVVERLRAVSHREVLRSANPEHEIVNELCKAVGIDRYSFETGRCRTYTGTLDAISDRLIELIEHGGKQDVDVAALQGLSDKIDACASYLGHGGCADLACNMSDAAEDMFGIDEETNMADARVMLETIAERIRMAIDGAPKQSNIVALCRPCRTKREAAADWVEQQGGLDEVKHHYAFVVERIAERVGVERGSDEPEHVTIGKIIEELDKRLMPQGMEWPRFEDGERVPLDCVESPMWAVSYEHAMPSSSWWCTGVEMRRRGEVVIHASDGARDAATISLKRGQRVKRPEPEVLGADGLPIKVGETVYLDAEHADMAGKDLLDSYFSCGLHGVDAGAMLTVSEVKGAGKVSLESDNDAWCPASWLTHTPPDTQKRIDEDARKSACDYFGRAGKWCNGEGGCPAYSLNEHEFEGCRHFATADLLRRQRELDAKTMGGE